jgi:hypothetical protein
MNQGQVTLFQAIRIAEERTGGRAVTAKCELHHIPADDPVHDALETPNAGLMINVCCVADDKIIDVKIDARHRKIVEMKLRCLPRESLASNPGNLQ